jgi:fumarate reductase flavoprotein subunit
MGSIGLAVPGVLRASKLFASNNGDVGATARVGGRKIKTLKESYDVAVVGGGCSGTAAALAAAEEGLKVAVFEKADFMGGDVHGGNGPFAVGTAMQQESQIDFGCKEAFRLFMAHTHWRADARLISDYINKSADTVSWLQNLGVKFNDVVAYFPGAEFTWHYKDPESPNITEAIWERARELGAVGYLETPVVELVKAGGRVAGVVARDASGELIRVNAGAVIVATGGFGANPEWVKKYTGYEVGVDIFPFAHPGIVGDGIRMAWEAGGGATDMVMHTYASLPDPYWGPGGTAWELGSFRQPNLMVNLAGERFMNEEVMQDPGYAANAIHRQQDGCGFMIFDEAAGRYYEEHGWDFLLAKVSVKKPENFQAKMQKARDEGYRHLFMADSLDALGAETGIDPAGLRSTVAEYNRACDSGRDDVFYKDDRYLRPIRTPKFYAARFFLGGYGSFGGIRINHRTEVVSKNYDVIPGLYAVGRDANTIYADTYLFSMSGNDTAFDFNSGRIAGENAGKYLRAGRS